MRIVMVGEGPPLGRPECRIAGDDTWYACVSYLPAARRYESSEGQGV